MESVGVPDTSRTKAFSRLEMDYRESMPYPLGRSVSSTLEQKAGSTVAAHKTTDAPIR